MKEEVYNITGEKWIHLNNEEIKIGFLSQCIEALAEEEHCHYVEMLDRLEKANMTEGYILAHYDVLHTESMENIIHELKQLLHRREDNKCALLCLMC